MPPQQGARPPVPSVTTSETFREVPPAPSSARHTPVPAGGPRKYTYRELVDAFRAEFPGEFDAFDPSDLAEEILAESPEYASLVDPSSKGTESVDLPDLDAAAGRTRTKVQYGPKGRIGPADARVPQPDPNMLRLPSYTDMGIEAGLVAVPSILGGVIGSGVGPGGTAVGAVAGGAAGEGLREGYQNWAQTRDDFSLPNVAAQGLLNAVPIAKYVGKGASALAPQLVERVAPSVARVAATTAEGAIASAGSTALEAGIRDRRMPELSELGTSAAFGAPFGAAIGTGMELHGARQANAALPDPALVTQHFQNLADPATRTQAAQAIYELATQVGENGNPAAGAALLQRLVAEARGHAETDLRQFAAAFVQDFGRRADTLSMDSQASEVESFLAGLKERGAAQETLTQVDGVLRDIRRTSSPRPVDQPSDVGWHTQLDPAYGPHGPSEFSPLNSRELIPNMGPEVDPGQTRAEQKFGETFVEGMAGQPAVRNVPVLRDPADGTPAYSTARNPPRDPLQQDLNVPAPKAPWELGPPVGGDPPSLQPRGVDALPGVQAGVVSRDSALFLQWIANDLTEGQFQPGERVGRSYREELYNDPSIGSQEEYRRRTYTPRQAGTPVYDAIWKLAGHTATGQSGSRTTMATQIGNMLKGTARRPGKYAMAAQKLGTLMQAAWVPETGRFDWSLVTQEQLAAAGWRDTRAALSRMMPYTPLGFVADGQPHDLLAKYGVRSSEQLSALEQAAELTPDELSEARQLVRTASDADLQRLYTEMTEARADVPDLEDVNDFGGAWYDVGPGLIGAELERRGLGKYTQPGLEMEGPGTPGRSKVVPDEVPRLDETATQPELLPGVRTQEQRTPLLMEESELFSLTPENANPPAPRRGQKPAPGLFDDTGAVGDVKGTKLKRQAAQRDLTIGPDDFDDLRKTVEAAGGEEVAGILVGDPDGTVRRVILSDNRAANPEKQFEMGADVVARAQHFARSKGWEVLGSFHSQPTGSAEPSKLDLRGNVADLPMMILGVRGGSLRDVRVWQPSGGKSAPWLEGQVNVARQEVPSQAAIPMAPSLARDLVERIPRFTGAPGDIPALNTYLKTHKGEFSTEPWYVRAQQFLEEGNARQAWVEVQAATLAYQKAGRTAAQSVTTTDAHRAALLARVEQATAAGPQDPVGALFALYDGRTTWVEGVGRVVVAPEVPPALQGRGVTAGPGGLLNPGKSSLALADDAATTTMSLEVINGILADTKATGILDDPTKNSFTRLNRQVAEQLMLRAPSSYGGNEATRTAMRAQGLSERQINQQLGAHFVESVSNSAKILASLSVWKARHATEIRSIEGIKGASGDIEDVIIVGAGGRKVGRLGDLAPIDTFKDIVAPTRAWDRIMLLNDLTQAERSTFDVFEAASRGFMLSQVSTANRNLFSVTGRWGVEVFDEVLTGVAYTIGMRPGRAINHFKKAADMARYTPVLRPDGWVMPWHAMHATWEQVMNSSTWLATRASGKERLAVHKLIAGIPDEQAHFLGSAAAGEPTPTLTSKYRVLNYLGSQKVQNFLTMFNRAQEFTERSGKMVVNLREQMRLAGQDPDHLWQLPPADLMAKVGGPEVFQRMLHHSIAGALDHTFSGSLIRKGYGKSGRAGERVPLNTKLIDLINNTPAVRAGYPFPRFNFSAAPRWMWDHSGVVGVVESLNQVLLETQGTKLGTALKAGMVGTGYALGGPEGAAVGGALAMAGGRYETRLSLGRKASKYTAEHIPEATAKLYDAQADLGDALQKVQTLSKEHTALKRTVARLERKGLAEAADAERPGLEQLDAALQRELQAFEEAETRLKNHTASRKALQDVVDEAHGAGVPMSYEQRLGRAAAGTALLLTPALLLRAEQQEKKTEWYNLRYDIPGFGDTTIDTRPFAPFTQELFIADVLNDFWANTDWAGVAEDMRAEDGSVDLRDSAKFLQTMYGRYEGKYTNKTLGAQFMNAFLSMSQMAGTTLAIGGQLSKISEQGFPNPSEAWDTVVTAIGSLFARYTIPFAQFKGLASDMVKPDESNARILSTAQGPFAPLLQPLVNLPFVGSAVVPETYNQLTGQALDTYMPWLRSSLGISTRQWNRVGGEIAATGVPGASVYIRKTNDVFLDRLIGFHYAQAVSIFADQLIFQNEEYLALDSPATRRDYLQARVFPALKKYALGQAMVDVGWQRMQEERESPEQRRRRLRNDRLEGLAKEEGVSFEEEPGAEPEIDPDPTDPGFEPYEAGAAPGGSPGSAAPSLESPPRLQGRAGTAPDFDETDAGPGAPSPAPPPMGGEPGAMDRALAGISAPAFDG